MEPINYSPNENIIIKFKLSDIKPKPKSIDSDSEQQNSIDSKEGPSQEDNNNSNPSNYSYNSNDQQSSGSSELQSFEKDLQNNLKCREEQLMGYQQDEEIQEKIEKRVKTDQETKQSNSLLYSHDKTNQKNQKRQYQKQNQHIKESYVDLPVSKERMLQLSLESAQKFQQKLLYANLTIRPFIKAIEDNYQKGDEMTSKEGFPANSIPFLIYNENNNKTHYYQNGALQAQQTTVEKFINLNTQGDKDCTNDKIHFPGTSYLGYSNFMRKRRKRRSHAQILSDNLAKLQEESQKIAQDKEQQQLQQQLQASSQN